MKQLSIDVDEPTSFLAKCMGSSTTQKVLTFRYLSNQKEKCKRFLIDEHDVSTWTDAADMLKIV